MLARTLPQPQLREDAPLWPLALFVCAVALFWHDTLMAQFAHSPHLAPRHVTPQWAAAVGVTTQLVCSALEAWGYARVWSAFGRRLPWWRTTASLFVISALEAFALFLLIQPGSSALTWCVGARALWQEGVITDGLARAFGGVGALAILRLALTAQVEARGTGGRFAPALAIVLAGWFGTRLALWWTLDLLRGRSFTG